MKNKYNKTIYACFIGYVVQAVVNNFVPLLFVILQASYQIPLEKITLLITLNFGLQLIIDLLSIGFIDRIGYRASVVIAHFCAAIGLVSLTILPEIFTDKFMGLLIAVMIYAIGGGLLEVLVSPIVEACPTDNKEKAMSLLHSFYCWGHVGVVLITTIFLRIFGTERWNVLAVLWAVIPVLNGFLFLKVPITSLVEKEEQQMSLKSLIGNKVFWVLMLLMFSAGACEQAVSQWASTFAEKGLNVTKAVGDLAGPMMFATLMGTSRVFYGKYGEKIRLERFMLYSGILCLSTYLVISLAPVPVIALIGCGICGLSVGILWPGSFSMAAKGIPNGGTALFALLALAGDLGCTGGPTFVGFVSSSFNDNLKAGILGGIVFPMILLLGIFLYQFEKKKKHA